MYLFGKVGERGRVFSILYAKFKYFFNNIGTYIYFRPWYPCSLQTHIKPTNRQRGTTTSMCAIVMGDVRPVKSPTHHRRNSIEAGLRPARGAVETRMIERITICC